MKTLALILAICLPLVALVFISQQKDAKSWQHYGLITALTIYSSILLLGTSGKLASFGYGDAKVEFVAQKVEEVKALVEEIRKLAKITGELSVIATQPSPIGHLIIEEIDYPKLIAHYGGAKQKIEDVLKQAGRTEDEIQKTVEPLTKEIQRLEAEQAKELKPN